jgi:hypothetical protein
MLTADNKEKGVCGRKINIQVQFIYFIILLFILPFGLPSIVAAQVDTLSWDLVMSQEWERPERLDSFVDVHPRLLLSEARVESLKYKITTTHKEIWEIIKERADSYIGQNPPSDYSDEDDMRSAGRGIPWQVLAYVLSGSSVYFEGAKTWIMTICSYPKWQNNISLAAGECLFGVSIGYDWLYNDLTAEERNLIREKLRYQAEAMKNGPPVHYDNWLANHNHVEHNGLAASGFVLYDEEPEAINWIRQADLVFQTAFLVGSDDGSSTEGHQYWAYSMESILCYTEAARDLMGINYYDSKWLKGAMDFIIYCTIPDFNTMPGNPDFANCVMSFGDSHRDYRSHGPVHILCRLASEYNNGCAQWLADEMIQRGVGVTDFDFRAWANLLWYDETIIPASLSNLPTVKHFEDIGWITTRSGWDEDAVMIGFKCGPFHGHKVQPYYEKQVDEGWNSYHTIVNGHGHPDVNSYQIYAYGKWLATEPGYARPKYTYDHCTIVAGGLGQLGEGSNWFDRQAVMDAKGKSTIIKAESTVDYDYIIGDAENIYRSSSLTKFYRHFVYIKPDIIVIADELEASPSSNYFEWRLRTTHKRAEFVDDMNIDKQNNDYYIIKNNNDADVVVMDVHFIHPELENFSTSTIGDEFLKADFNSTGADLLVIVMHPRRDEYNASTIVSSSFVNSVLYLTIEFDAEEIDVAIDLTKQKVAIVTDIQGGDIQSKPDRYCLMQNYPNPFNISTIVQYWVPIKSRIGLTVYDLLGQPVKSLVNGNYEPGIHAVRWDGTNINGEQVASGIYFYRITMNGWEDVKKIVYLR